MKEIIVDGVTYVPKEEDPRSKWAIVVLERGYIYVGHVTPTGKEKLTGIKIEQARCIVYWGTTKHLAELAANGPLSSTKLGDLCTINAPLGSVIHTIDTKEELWKK